MLSFDDVFVGDIDVGDVDGVEAYAFNGATNKNIVADTPIINISCFHHTYITRALIN